MSSEYVDFEKSIGSQYSNESIDADPGCPLIGDVDNSALINPLAVEPREVSVLKNKRCSRTTTYLVILCISLLAALIVVSLVWVNGKKSTNKSKRDNNAIRHILQVSDTHLDIYYDSNVTKKFYQGCRNKAHKDGSKKVMKSNTTALYGRVGCDAPSFLLDSLKTQLDLLRKELDNDLDFIILTGDQAAHSYDYFDVDVLDSVLWSIANSTKYISDALPGIPIYMTIGNNDLKIDYIPPYGNHSLFYQKLYDIFVPYVFPENSNLDTHKRKKKFRETFELGGYYSLDLNGGSILLVVLNTNYWSSKSYHLKGNVTTIGNIQLSWFTSQLESAKKNKQKVIISGHIPPGMSAYDGTGFWLSNYTTEYIKLVSKEFSSLIIGQLYGHIHSDRVKLHYSDGKYNEQESHAKSFLLTAPSITPIYGSNPAFRVFDYDSKQNILSDYNQYYLDLAASNVNKRSYWLREYSFTDTYKVSLSTEGLEKVVQNFLDPSNSAWFHYSQHIKSKMGGISYNQRYHEYCVARYATPETYQKCSEAFKDIGA